MTGARIAGVLLGWLFGIALNLQQRALWPVAVLWTAAALGGVGVVGVAAIRPRGQAAWLAVGGAALLAFGVAGLEGAAARDDRLAPALEGRDLRIVGVVASLPQRAPDGLRFSFDAETATLDGARVHVPARLGLGWYKSRGGDAAQVAGPMSGAARVGPSPAALSAGQRWRLTLRLKRPHGGVNPYGFDAELQLFEQGIGATGYVRDTPPPLRLDLAAAHPVERLRQRVRDAIEATVPDRRTAGVLAALAVGDQSAIDRQDWELYRNTGIAHLVSISGLHITMFAWVAGGAIARCWRRSARAMRLLPTPIAARFGGVACAAAYAVFSGWGVPSQRTVWMLATVALLQTVGVRWPWGLVLATAAAVVTAFDPWALLQAGFWLSFAAVGLLMASSSVGPGTPDAGVATPGWRGWPRRALGVIRADLRTQVIATIGLTPLTLVFFQQVSVVGFLANLIAIPTITLLITPLALLGAAFAPLWVLGAVVVGALNTVLGALLGWPGAVWRVPVAPLWAQAAGLLGALVLMLPWPWRGRLLAVPLVLPLLLPARPLPPPGRFDLIALDVGQGTAVVVRTRAHLLIFDAGPQYGADSDAGARVLLPLLRARGETRIDRLVLSHRDLDHVGGAAALMQALPVDELLSSLEDGHPLLALAPRTTRCHVGQAWTWDGVRFEMLRPAPEDYARSLKPNAMSCVLRVADAHRSALLTGDIEREQEAALLGAARDRLPSQVLIAPHHGSKTSSTGAFLDAVAPRIAVFQAGYRNRFGHPAPEVLQRYLDRGIAVRTSPDCGAFVLDARGPDDGRCERASSQRYWRFDVSPTAGYDAPPSRADPPVLAR